MERPLFKPKVRPIIHSENLDIPSDEEIDPSVLFQQFTIDKARLRQNIRKALQMRSQVSLSELVQEHPIERGLAELVTYFQMGVSELSAHVDETSTETVEWWTETKDGLHRLKKIRLPLVIFVREGS
jgi:hypothetical protein